MTKRDCRRALRQLREGILDRKEKDQRILERLWPLLPKAGAILTYVSCGTEVDTRVLCQRLLTSGRILLVPRCEKGGHMRFYEIKSMADLVPGQMDLLEPATHCALGTPASFAVCLVPGLGFTRKGERIGYGKGYYDRFLRETGVKSIGLCYNEQIRGFLPIEPHDVRLSQLVTDQLIQEVSHG